MAKRTIIVDDLDGKEAVDGDEIDNHRFGLDGRSWEIDLSSTNYEALDAALQPFITAAREVVPRDRTRGRKGKAAGVNVNGNGHRNGTNGGGGRAIESAEDRREIRSWAALNGYNISDKGALPMEVVDAWRHANRGQRT